jgi:dTMP kinase
MTGLFVAIEGPEGAGKTTLAEALAGRLAELGREVVRVREPGGTPVAEATPLAEVFLILAARADLVARVIEPALGRGAVVLCDRYDLSTEAYQIAGRQLDAEGIRRANRLATGGLKPDVTLVLDLPPSLGRARQVADGKVPDRLEQADAAFHARVAHAFQSATGRGVVHVDATQPVAVVERVAWEVIEPMAAKQSGAARVV